MDDVEVIVNAWNRNVLPWWLLVPSGVSGAIRRHAGTSPFRELWHLGPIPLGGAVTTGPGRLRLRGIIHVAGINLAWRASEASVASSTRSALAEARARGFFSVAFPVIGSGTGGLTPDRAFEVMLAAIEADGANLRVVVARWR